MNSIQYLIELQNIDSKLQELDELLGDLPAKVNKLVDEENRLISSLEHGKSRLKDIEIELRKAELDVVESGAKIDKLKDQLFLVTSNKQYDALMLEIDHLKDDLDRYETKDIELMEEKSQLEETIKSQELNLDSLSSDLSSRREKLEKIIFESKDKKKLLETQRDKKVKDLEPVTLTRYNRIRNAKNGLAVVAIEGRSCGGCGATLPLQIMAEVKTNTTIFNCDVCGRFLYWKK